MVARAGGYFGLLFKGCHVMTQGKPLSPTLFNVVMDAVIHHWVTVVVPTNRGMEVLGVYMGLVGVCLFRQCSRPFDQNCKAI